MSKMSQAQAVLQKMRTKRYFHAGYMEAMTGSVRMAGVTPRIAKSKVFQAGRDAAMAGLREDEGFDRYAASLRPSEQIADLTEEAAANGYEGPPVELDDDAGGADIESGLDDVEEEMFGSDAADLDVAELDEAEDDDADLDEADDDEADEDDGDEA